jgi:hypothetical protein
LASYQTLLNFGTQNVGEMVFKMSFDPIIRDLKNSIGYCAQSSNFPNINHIHTHTHTGGPVGCHLNYTTQEFMELGEE